MLEIDFGRGRVLKTVQCWQLGDIGFENRFSSYGIRKKYERCNPELDPSDSFRDIRKKLIGELVVFRVEKVVYPTRNFSPNTTVPVRQRTKPRGAWKITFSENLHIKTRKQRTVDGFVLPEPSQAYFSIHLPARNWRRAQGKFLPFRHKLIYTLIPLISLFSYSENKRMNFDFDSCQNKNSHRTPEPNPRASSTSLAPNQNEITNYLPAPREFTVHKIANTQLKLIQPPRLTSALFDNNTTIPHNLFTRPNMMLFSRPAPVSLTAPQITTAEWVKLEPIRALDKY